MKAAIIEDEVRTARLLKKTLEENNIEVIGIISSIEEGITFFRQKPEVHVIFSDIEITDGLCFDLFREVTVDCPVIFCTAFNQYALEAFRANGIDYIVKPFTEKSIREAINKFRNLTRSNPEHSAEKADLYELLKTTLVPRKTTILVNYREKTFPVSLASVAYFFIEGENTILNTEGREYTLSKSLEELEAIVDPQQFFRANRQYLINRTYICEIERSFARKLSVKLTLPVNEPIVVSKARASEFLDWLEQ